MSETKVICRLAWDYPEAGKPSYGLQPVYYYLSREQVKQGYEVHVIAAKHSSQSREEIDGAVKIHRVNPPFNVNGFRKTREIIRKHHRNSIIHAHATCGLFMTVAKHILKVPLVSHVHSTTRSSHSPVKLNFGGTSMEYSRSKSAYYFQREKIFWSSSDKVLSVSNTVANDLAKYYSIPRQGITSVYNGIDPNLFRPTNRIRIPEGILIEGLEGKRIVLYVGRFALRKGLLFLVSAMNQVIREVPDAVLLCIGGVPSWLNGGDDQRLLHDAISRNGLKNKVIVMNRVPNQRLPFYYSSASVCVLPSYYEALGKVAIEAMACGKPVIATKEGGLVEVVDDGLSGYLVDFGSVSQLSQSIITLLQDTSLASRMGVHGRKKALRDFTWAEVARRVKMAYATIPGELLLS